MTSAPGPYRASLLFAARGWARSISSTSRGWRRTRRPGWRSRTTPSLPRTCFVHHVRGVAARSADAVHEDASGAHGARTGGPTDRTWSSSTGSVPGFASATEVIRQEAPRFPQRSRHRRTGSRRAQTGAINTYFVRLIRGSRQGDPVGLGTFSIAPVRCARDDGARTGTAAAIGPVPRRVQRVLQPPAAAGRRDAVDRRAVQRQRAEVDAGDARAPE